MLWQRPASVPGCGGRRDADPLTDQPPETPNNRSFGSRSVRALIPGPYQPQTAAELPPIVHVLPSSSSGSLPTRQVQMFDVAIPLVVELLLSASYILPPSSSPASFVLVFLLLFFLAFSLRLPFLTVILLLECVRSTSFVWFLFCV